ncbi:MAG: 50S ribosomal protein L16 [Verrucomicrobiota bacterium]|nr:50S ribosomal protein L16 [Verrucomicrobiota bacterium]
MALQPFRTKYRKWNRGHMYGKATRCNSLAFGDFGIQAMESCWITGQQIEAARVAINRYLNRRGKLYIRIFPHQPITRKPAEVRMGSGKGSVEYYVAACKAGTVIFEVSGVPLSAAKEAMRLGDTKLPLKCRFISREEA